MRRTVQILELDEKTMFRRYSDHAMDIFTETGSIFLTAEEVECLRQLLSRPLPEGA